MLGFHKERARTERRKAFGSATYTVFENLILSSVALVWIEYHVAENRQYINMGACRISLSLRV
jgi:hypothetical protein